MQTCISSKDILSDFLRSRAQRSTRGGERSPTRLALAKRTLRPFSLDTKCIGGAERDRTADPLLAKQVLSQLSYSPISLVNQTNGGPGKT